jgi:hypothetical protein
MRRRCIDQIRAKTAIAAASAKPNVARRRPTSIPFSDAKYAARPPHRSQGNAGEDRVVPDAENS